MVALFLFAWIVACAAVFFALLLSDRRLSLQRPLLVIVAVAVVARLVPLLVFREPTGLWGTDINNYRTVAELVLAHSDVYPVAGKYVFLHPYLPFFMYILAASEWASRLPGLSFFTIIRLPLVLADVGIAVLVFYAVKELRKDVGAAANVGMAYAVCPLPIFVTVYHGQFDALPIFFAFLAWYLVYFSKPGLSWVAGAGAALGLGILMKSWPLLLFPALFFGLMRATGSSTPVGKAPTALLALLSRPQWREKLVVFTGVTAAVPAVAVMIYLVSFQASFVALRMKNLEYRAPFLSTYAEILDHLGLVVPRATDWAIWTDDHERLIMYSVLLVVTVLLVPRRGLLTALVTLIAVALITSRGAHHYVWIVPFALVAGQRAFFVVYSSAAFITLLIVGFYVGGVYFGSQSAPFGEQGLPHMWLLDVAISSILVLWVLTNMAGSFWERFYIPSADELDEANLTVSDAEPAASKA